MSTVRRVYVNGPDHLGYGVAQGEGRSETLSNAHLGRLADVDGLLDFRAVEVLGGGDRVDARVRPACFRPAAPADVGSKRGCLIDLGGGEVGPRAAQAASVHCYGKGLPHPARGQWI